MGFHLVGEAGSWRSAPWDVRLVSSMADTNGRERGIDGT